MGERAKPMMAKRRARDSWEASSKSAGISLRLARSPEAPKITMVQGSAGVTELADSAARASATSLVGGVIGKLLGSLYACRGLYESPLPDFGSVLMACPPNWWRRAASSLRENESLSREDSLSSKESVMIGAGTSRSMASATVQR